MQYDFTSCMGVMYVIGMVVFFFGLAAIIVTLFAPGTGRIMYLVYAGLAALVFSMVRSMHSPTLIPRAVSGDRRATGNGRE